MPSTVLARDVDLRSVTPIRDDASILPLEPSGSILAVMPRPADHSRRHVVDGGTGVGVGSAIPGLYDRGHGIVDE